MTTQELEQVSGLLLIDKPAGPTSHFVVSKIKRILKAERVGHLGTLDPFASGMLPILVNGATRLADDTIDGKKTYLFTIGFGSETDTLDHTGRVVETKEVPDDFAVRCANALEKFVGEIEQVPPVYSALKMNGMPLYEHMRGTGKLPVDIESKKRVVRIDSFEPVSFEERGDAKNALLRVTCGKGTYVRSLARDVARAIETVGSCTTLRREYVEPWHVRDAVNFGDESQMTREHLLSKIISPLSMLPSVPFLKLEENERRAISAGNSFLVSSEDFEARSKTNAGAMKLFVGIDGILFFAETSVVDGRVKIQPRKKIS